MLYARLATLAVIAASTGAFVSPAPASFAAGRSLPVPTSVSFVLLRSRGGGKAPPTVDAEKDATISTGTTGSDVKPNTINADATESGQLQLESPAMVESMGREDEHSGRRDSSDDDDDVNIDDTRKEKTTKLTKFRTYHDPTSNATVYGLGLSLRKFRLWVESSVASTPSRFDPDCLITENVALNDSSVRCKLRSLWNSSNLISDRTEFLAVYQSERDKLEEGGMEHEPVSRNNSNGTGAGRRKRGDFADLLPMYADRLVSIIQDEQEEERALNEKARRIQLQQNMTEAEDMEQRLLDGVSGGLVGYLRREYGDAKTSELLATSLLGRSKEEQFAVLQTFLDWFRTRFPYYYDRCDACGASAKEDGMLSENCETSVDDENAKGTDISQEEDLEDDGGTFLGYVYPSEEELQGKAGRTEIYCCQKCGAISRFPRYNAASSVLTSRRGRCGEYSMLILRFFRALGYSSRWVVDWSDHVWAEVFLEGKWIHIDPCESAIDNNLLYESWGKRPTYIIAFHPSQQDACTPGVTCSCDDTLCIEDVTAMYTSDNRTVIEGRRKETKELVKESLNTTQLVLRKKLQQMCNQ